jgi:hypothetical protein
MSMRGFFDKDGTFSKLWNSLYFGIPLWCIAAIYIMWSWFHLPSPGKAIGALAVVAGIMSVRDIKVLGKISWVALLVLMLVTEFRAIDKDRSENETKQKEFFDAQRHGFQAIAQQADADFKTTKEGLDHSIAGVTNLLGTTQKAVENITGGTSFAYVYPDFGGGDATEAILKIHNAGHQILTGVTINVNRVTQGNWELGVESLTSLTDDRNPAPTQPITLAPDSGEFIRNYRLHPKLNADGTAAYHIFIYSQNGGSGEDLYFRPSKDGRSLAYKFRVSGRASGKRKKNDVTVDDGKNWYRYVCTVDWTEPKPANWVPPLNYPLNLCSE